jgi:AcrR family transcriptional regulator
MSATATRNMRRAEIISAARDLFSRKGYHGTTMPDIAHAAGISTGLIYYIFPAKEDILLACCQDTAAMHLEIFTRTEAIADPLERFDAIVHELYSSLDAESQNLIIMYKDISTIPRETRHSILAAIRNLDQQFVELFNTGQRAGVFDPDIPNLSVLAANVLALGHTWALQHTWHFVPQGITLEAYISAQLDYFHAQLLSA